MPPVRLAAARVQGRQGAARFSLELALRWPPCHVSAERDMFGLCLVRRGLRPTERALSIQCGGVAESGATACGGTATRHRAPCVPVAVVLAPLRAGGSGLVAARRRIANRWLDLKWLSAAADFSSKAVTAANFDGSRGGVGGWRSTVTCTGSTLGLPVLYFAVSIGRGPGRCGKAAFTSVKLPRLDFTRSIFFDGVRLVTKFLYRPNIPTGFSDGF